MEADVSDEERYQELAMRAVDGHLTEAESAELAALTEGHPDRVAELEDFHALKRSTDAMRDRIAATARIEPLRANGVTKTTLTFAFALVWVGLIGLYAFAAYRFATDPEVPIWAKAAGGVFGVGLLILFLYVLRVRLRGLRHDPYKEIDR